MLISVAAKDENNRFLGKTTINAIRWTHCSQMKSLDQIASRRGTHYADSVFGSFLYIWNVFYGKWNKLEKQKSNIFMNNSKS